MGIPTITHTHTHIHTSLPSHAHIHTHHHTHSHTLTHSYTHTHSLTHSPSHTPTNIQNHAKKVETETQKHQRHHCASLSFCLRPLCYPLSPRLSLVWRIKLSRTRAPHVCTP